MKAVTQTDLFNPYAPEWANTSEPVLENRQVLAEVKTTDVSRADLLQATDHHLPPESMTDTFGLECAGVVREAEGGSQDWKVGDEVYCLLSGGAHTERVAVPAGQILPLSCGHSFAEAASIAGAACMVFLNVTVIASLKEGDLLLIHSGAGGINTFATQMTKRLDVCVAVIAGSAEKLAKYKKPGADILINYKGEDFTEIVAAESDTSIVLGIVDAEYLNRNAKALAKSDRLVIVSMQSGVKNELNIGRLLDKRGSIAATGLCYRDLANKTRIVNATKDTIWSMLINGAVTPQVRGAMDIRSAARIHKLPDSGAVSGKIVLIV